MVQWVDFTRTRGKKTIDSLMLFFYSNHSFLLQNNTIAIFCHSNSGIFPYKFLFIENL